MTKRERDLLCLRFAEVDFELAAVAEGREAQLLEEQERIEYELGADYMERRDWVD